MFSAAFHRSRVLSRIQEASKVPIEGVSMNRDLVRDHVFKLSDMDAALRRTVRALFSDLLAAAWMPVLMHV